jgi:hypothetical protein
MSWSFKDKIIEEEAKSGTNLRVSEGCPYLTEEGGCDHRITSEYFARLCTSTAYLNCYHYCKRRGYLKTPIEWLQRKAIESDLKHGNV